MVMAISSQMKHREIKTLLRRFFIFWLFFFCLAILANAFVGVIRTPQFFISIIERQNLASFNKVLTTNIDVYGREKVKPILCDINQKEGVSLYMLGQDDSILACNNVPDEVKLSISKIKQYPGKKYVYRVGNYMVSRITRDKSKLAYWLILDGESRKLLHASYSFFITRGFIAALLGSVILVLISYYFSLPLLRVSKGLSHLKGGDFSARLNKKRGSGVSEISDLQESFNQMSESLASLLDSKKDILETIGHELRAPLARQQLAIDLLRDDRVTDKLKHLERIDKENARLQQLIQELLALAKIHTQYRKLNMVVTNLNQLMDEVIHDAQFESSTMHINLIADKQYDCVVDKDLIRRAVENIVRNAYKYAGDNGHINIALRQTNVVTKITIEDDGPGVDELRLSHIFQPFYRNTDGEAATKGYGLGLAIAKECVLLHQGSIKAENRKEGGLKMTIILPNV